MKSTAVYREARQTLAPWCKKNGFRRTSGGMLGWYRPLGDEFVVFWLQCSQDGWDAYAGSKFVVEFQRSPSKSIGDLKSVVRHRLPYFLRDDELQTVQAMQNEVIAQLPQPPEDYFVYGISESVAKWYRAKFEPIREPYTNQSDIWLRYQQPSHVQQWAEFLLALLPRILEQVETETAR